MKHSIFGLCIAVLLIGDVARAQPSDVELEAARQSIVDIDWKQTIKLYTPIREAAAAGSDIYTEATFCLAVANHHVQPPDGGTIANAKSLYQKVIEQSPGGKWAARAMMNLGRIDELRDYPDDVVNFDSAREQYLKVVQTFPNDPIAGEATLRAAATLIMAFDEPDYTKVKQGIAMLEQWLASHPDEALKSVMWQYTGDAYFRPLADYKNALRCYEEVDRLGWSDKGNQGPWYWRSAQIAERYLDQPDIAAKYYRKIIVETPNSGKAYESILALKRLGKPVPSSPMFESPVPTTQRSNP